MKVKKNKSERLSISEVNDTFVIVVKKTGRWCIVQADDFEQNKYRLLTLDNACLRHGNRLTIRNTYSAKSIEDWFDKCEEMHVFKTTKKAFKFLIKKL